jgi:hypothetical protein
MEPRLIVLLSALACALGFEVSTFWCTFLKADLITFTRHGRQQFQFQTQLGLMSIP